MKLLTQLLLLAGLSALTAAAIVSHWPPDLSGVRGAQPVAGVGADIADLLEQAGIKRSAPFEISEADLNRHLAASIVGRQAGRTGRVAQFHRVLVDLEPDRALVTLCWKTGGHETTTTLDLRLAQAEGKHRAEIAGGAVGRLPVARGFLPPILPAYRALADACERELQGLLAMTRIQFGHDKLMLDPRYL